VPENECEVASAGVEIVYHFGLYKSGFDFSGKNLWASANEELFDSEEN